MRKRRRIHVHVDDHWLEDLLTEILLRLPIKSLVRFRSVAKTWRSLLQTPRFVSQHLGISKRKGLLIYSQDRRPKILGLLQLDQSLVSYEDFPPQELQHIHISYHFCVYDGLFCIFDVSTVGFTLWNPATRDFRILPKFPRKRKGKVIVEIGFGRGYSSNDYKVICMWRDSKDYCAEAAVYTLSSNSWRMLEDVELEAIKNLYIHMVLSYGNTFVNGVYYWTVFDAPGKKVLAFHFDEEVFQMIDWPSDGSEYIKGKLLPLPQHGGRISIWSHHYNGSSVTNEIWGLDDDGRSWSKLLTIGPLPVIRMYGFWNGKVLVKSLLGQRNLLLYDVDTEEFIDLGKTNTRIIEVYTYEESLVPIKL